MNNNSLFIVFGHEGYNELGIVRSLGESGIHPIFVSVHSEEVPFASKSKYVSKAKYVNSIKEGYQYILENFVDYETKGFIIATTDKIVSYLDSHYDEIKDRFFFFNGGENNRLTKYMDKIEICKIADKHGLNVLKVWRVKKGLIPEDIEYPVITKSISPIIGGWKQDVFVCNSEADLEKAFSRIKSDIVVLQKYINKKNELALQGCCVDRGNEFFVSVSTNQKYLVSGRYTTYLDVNIYDNPSLESVLREIMKEIGFEGVFEIEFLIAEDETLYFLEVNFRNTAFNYASTSMGLNLQTIWAESMLTGKIEVDKKSVHRKKITAMAEPYVFADRVKSHEISMFKWIIDVVKCDCKFYMNARDMRPIIAKAFGVIKRKVKRN